MKIDIIGLHSLSFKSRRQDKKTISQLSQDHEYDLNKPNQRRISAAIARMSEIPTAENIEFLINTSKNLKYGTNINLDKSPFNDWKAMLTNAAENASALSNPEVRAIYTPQIEDLKIQKPITKEEKAILKEREKLLKSVDFEQLKSIKSINIKNLRRNLDYFIISSEVPTSQKLYILKRLNYFMSKKYKINPQLEDKKTQALAEIINDIVIDTPESKIPNSKEINQNQHGICAAISICRKALAYEDKANYVDMILSELDSSDDLEVYDINKLGTHTKIKIPKIEIDFNTALNRGYRIVDTSAMYWMQVADTAGPKNEIIGQYNAFDNNFDDTFTDTHINADLSEDLTPKQDYFRSLVKAKTVLSGIKAELIERKFTSQHRLSHKYDDLRVEGTINNEIKALISEILINSSKEEKNQVFNDLISLQVNNAEKINKSTDYKKEFLYIPQESTNQKTTKIKRFLLRFATENKINNFDEKVQQIYNLLDEKAALETESSGLGRRILMAKELYRAAAAYRTQQVLELDIPQYSREKLEKYNIPDQETRLIDNIDMLITKINNNTINPELKEALKVNFDLEDADDETLVDSLNMHKENIIALSTDVLDILYSKIFLQNRKFALAAGITKIKSVIQEKNDKKTYKQAAEQLKTKENKNAVLSKIDSYIKLLESEDCTEEEYKQIYNLMGYKSHMRDYADIYMQIGDLLFNQEANENILRGFNVLNGLNPDVSINESYETYKKIGDQFNELSTTLHKYEELLYVEDDNGNIINTVSEKPILLKKMENDGFIPKRSDLRKFAQKFEEIQYATTDTNGEIVHIKDLPKSLTSITPQEKEILKTYSKNINQWYSNVIRKLDEVYTDMKEPLEELNREIGVKTGSDWVTREGESGLCKRQQIKIIQHMTDRPYYAENNPKVSVIKIKNSPFSAISSTSVSEDRVGMHAQYIADVRPVSIITKDGKEVTQDAVFHDNTWGPIEYENLWKDDNGNLRTDYARKLGGKEGFITDDKYLTGLTVSKLVNGAVISSPRNIPSKQYKKLTGIDEEFYLPIFSDTIIQGVYPRATNKVKTIRENLLISPSEYLEDLTEYAKKMTHDELVSRMKKNKIAASETYKTYQDILKEINEDKILKHSINSIEEFNKLSNTNQTKILLEKLALIKSFNQIPDMKELYKQSTINDLQIIREKIKKEARNNFDYSLGKNKDIAIYGTQSVRSEIYKELKDLGNRNNIKISNTKMALIANSMKNITQKEFDGSVKNTIDLMISNLEMSLYKNLNGIDNKNQQISHIVGKIKESLTENMTVKTFDEINSPLIERWIDKVFEPATDDEFIKIYNDLRNLTTEEFRKKYNNSIQDEDLNIRSVTGYDVLKQLRINNEQMHNLLFNVIYYQKCYQNMEMSQLIPSYDYGKFSRTLNGAKYKNSERTFDDIYNDYYYTLMSLTLPDRMKKMGIAVFKKYMAFPAYPNIKITKDSADELFDKFENEIVDYSRYLVAFKAQQESLELAKKLNSYMNKHYTPNGLLTKNQQLFLNKIINEIVEINKDDPEIEETIEKVQNLVDSGTLSMEEYKNIIDMLNAEIKAFEKTIYGTTMDDSIKIILKNMDEYKNVFLQNLFLPKERVKAAHIINQWFSAYKKADFDNPNDKNFKQAERLKEEFKTYYNEHGLLKNPEKVLQDYLLMCAKDAPERKLHKADINNNTENKETEEETNSKNSYETRLENIQNSLESLLFLANLLNLQYEIMDMTNNGTLSAVSNALQKSQLELKDGSYVELSSDAGLNALLSPMLSEKNLKTATLFINQLNLSERVIDILTSNKSLFDNAYKSSKKLNQILSASDKQIAYFNKSLNKIIEDNQNVIEQLEQLKIKIMNYARRTGYTDGGKVLKAALDDTITAVQNNQNMPVKTILNSYSLTAEKSLKELLKTEIDVKMVNIKSLALIEELLGKLNYDEGSKSEEQINEFKKECRKYMEFQDSLPKEYPNIGVTGEFEGS